MTERCLNRRRLLAAVGGTAVSTSVLAGCLGGDDATDGDDGPIEIETRRGDEDEGEPNFVFDPDHVEVEPGQTIRWINTDGVFHTVTSTDSLDNTTPSGEFDETIGSEGDTFEWTTPDDDGVQHYYCSPHASFMVGTLEIGDAEAEEIDDDTDDENGDDEIDEEVVDMTGEDVVEIETRRGEDDQDEPNFVFDPAFVTVDEGTTIEWINTDGVFHTITSTDSIDNRSGGGDEFDASISSEGDTFEWEADEAGTQPYYCNPHAGFMFGAIEIE